MWRVIPSFPDYEVSETGDLRRATACIGTRVGKPKKWFLDEFGYRRYSLRKDGKVLNRRAHQLVAEAFLDPKPFDLAEVAHYDGSRTNDHYTNLRWASHSENMLDRRQHGTSPQGENHPFARLNENDVQEIRKCHAVGYGRKSLADFFAVTKDHISGIVSRERWKCIP